MRSVLLAAAALAAMAAAASAAPPILKSPGAAMAPAAAKVAPPGPGEWRTVDPQNLLVIDTNQGRILVEMVPEIAPLSVARIQELAHENFYDGLRFFRVVDDFMDQTGDPKNDGTGGSTKPNLPSEILFRRGADTPFVLALDQTVAEIGFLKSIPVSSQSMALAAMTRDQRVSAWGLFCPGVAGMARDATPDSANSQFFLMRGAYSSLDKHYTAWGRVVAGQSVVKAIKVGEPVADPQDLMERVRLAADLPEKDRPKVRVVDTASGWFKLAIARARADKGADFSACDVNFPAEVK